MSQIIEDVLKKMGCSPNNISEIIKTIPNQVYSFFDSFSSGELFDMIETLIYIYIAQNIRNEGVLRSNCKKENSVSLLSQLGLIREYKWYGNNVVRTLSPGNNISKKIIEVKAKEIQPNEFINFSPISKIIILNRIKNKFFTLPKEFPNQDYFDWYSNESFIDRLPYCNDFVFSGCEKLADELVRRGYGAIANYYVSSKGGQVREEMYVFSEEVAEILKIEIEDVERKLKDIKSFGKKVETRYEAIEFLQQYDPQKYQGIDEYRNSKINILDYLKRLGTNVVLSKELSATEFGGGIPFIIKNEKAYRARLQEFKVELDNEIEKELVTLNEKTLINSGAARQPGYDILKNLETKLREFIKKELSQISADWWKQRIPSDVKKNAEERKMKNEHVWPWYQEKDLPFIYYVDFADYIKIIRKRDNWNEVFKSHFADAEMISVKLRELEPIRNAIAHMRNLENDEINRLNQNSKDIIACLGKGKY